MNEFEMLHAAYKFRDVPIFDMNGLLNVTCNMTHCGESFLGSTYFQIDIKPNVF
jgi:hypothetical protein